MEQAGSSSQEAQSPQQPVNVNTVSIDRSLLCVAVGQVVINVGLRAPTRPPLHRMGWSHWVWVLLLGGFGLYSAFWLAVFALAHASSGRWGVPVGLFGGSVLLSLALLEWGVLGPRRAGRAVRALKGAQQ